MEPDNPLGPILSRVWFGRGTGRHAPASRVIDVGVGGLLHEADRSVRCRMDVALIRMGLVVLLFIVSGATNYFALRMSDSPASRERTVGVACGAAGILLMTLVLFWPILTLLRYFAGDASSFARLFYPLVCAATVCTLGSAAALLLASRKNDSGA